MCIRAGLGPDVVVPLILVARAYQDTRFDRSRSAQPRDRTLALPAGGQTNVTLELAEPSAINRELVERVHWYADDPRAALDALRAACASVKG